MKEKSLVKYKENIFKRFVNYFKNIFCQKSIETANFDQEKKILESEKTYEGEYNIEYIYKNICDGKILLDDLAVNDYIDVIIFMNKKLRKQEEKIEEINQELINLDIQY